MNRNKFGQFASNAWGEFVHFVKVCLVWGFVLAIIGGGIYVYASSKYVDKIVKPMEVTNLSDRWEENFKKDVELEKQRAGFKSEMATYEESRAESNVMHAYVTKLEQHNK